MDKPQPESLNLALRTFFVAIVVAVFVLSLFTVFFPYASMRFYAERNMRGRAAECAESYIKGKGTDGLLYDSKAADALLYALNSNISFMNSSSGKKAKKYAEKVAFYADIYLSETQMRWRSELNNAYYTDFSKNPDIYSHVQLCNFDNRTAVKRTEAKIILGQIQEEYDLIAKECEDIFNNAPSEDTSNSAVLILLKLDLIKELAFNFGGENHFFELIKNYLPAFKNYLFLIADGQILDKNASLTVLYQVNTVINFALSAADFAKMRAKTSESSAAEKDFYNSAADFFENQLSERIGEKTIMQLESELFTKYKGFALEAIN